MAVEFNTAKEFADILKGYGYDIPKNKVSKIETNANEIMNTENPGFGEEVTKVESLSDMIMDVVPQYSTFLNALPGNHGNQLGPIESLPIVGDPGFFLGGTERKDSPTTFPLDPTTKNPTDKVTIVQKKYVMRIDLSDELRNFSVGGAGNLEDILITKIGQAVPRTVEAAILNGDTETAASTNINAIDGAVTPNAYYLESDGIRKNTLITDPSSQVNVGTLDFSDFVATMDKLGDYAADPADMLWIFNRSTYHKALTVDEFVDNSKNGQGSTIYSGAIGNVLGSDIFIARDFTKTTATGEISVTPANNNVGQFLALHRSAVQYGFGGKVESQPLKLMVHNLGSQGIQLEAWFYFGYALVQKQAGQTDSSFGHAINVTLV